MQVVLVAFPIVLCCYFSVHTIRHRCLPFLIQIFLHPYAELGQLPQRIFFNLVMRMLQVSNGNWLFSSTGMSWDVHWTEKFYRSSAQTCKSTKQADSSVFSIEVLIIAVISLLSGIMLSTVFARARYSGSSSLKLHYADLYLIPALGGRSKTSPLLK